MTPPNMPGVLRGMRVEREPVHVGRTDSGEAEKGVYAVQSSDALIAEARGKAREEGWRAGHEEGRQRGYKEGLRSGLVDGMRQGQEAAEKNAGDALARVEEQQAALQRLQASVQEVLDQALLAAEDDIVALCFAALCRIVGDAGVEPELVRAQVASLLRTSAAGAGSIVRLHPQDAELLAGDAAAGPESHGVLWQPDPQVRLGGCILEQPHGGLDARLETLLQSCKARLLATRARRQPGGVAP